jgi:hypothetical protein
MAGVVGGLVVGAAWHMARNRLPSVMHRLRDSAKTDADRALYGEVSEIYKEMSWLGRGWNKERTTRMCAVLHNADHAGLSRAFGVAVTELVMTLECASSGTSRRHI